MAMTREDHIARHKKLHEALDELVADFITQNRSRRLKETSIMELIEWSNKQTTDPD